jgi:DNA helicase-2/ATP-dependent DNA helicase PcrA
MSGFSRSLDYSRELNQEQLDVVLNGDGPCLVLAGAGSGKTRTVVYRVAYLLEQGVDPSSILLLTFTNKAANEMLDRVSAILGGGSRGVIGGTFHSVANRFLRAVSQNLGYSNRFTILDQEDSRSLLKAVLKDAKIDVKARRFPSPAVIQSMISFSRNTLQPFEEVIREDYSNFEQLSGELEDIARQYAERKQVNNSMDFDDLLAHWLKLIEFPDIGHAMSQRFKYVLVDEYQDTNALQARIVSGISRVNKNVLVVGDDAQSIYAFRGADVKNILHFPDVWNGARIFKLLTNYRSVPEILNVANDSLAKNTSQFEKALIGVRPNGARPIVVPTASVKQEAEFIAERILAIHAQGTAMSNIAVLFRSSAHSQALEFELMKRDVPYDYRGGMKFFGRAHIKDVLAHLRVIVNPQDETAWIRALSLQPGVGAVTASLIASQAKNSNEISIVLNDEFASSVASRAQEGWVTLSRTLKIMLQHPDPSMMIRAVIEGPYRDYAEREFPDWRDRLQDMEQLSSFAENYTSLETFLADISLYDDVIAAERKGEAQPEDRLVLSTIHQAKGLEWDTVFLMHLMDNAFPSRYAIDDDSIEEERRLFYVAVTRAKSRLFLTYPQTSGHDTMMFNRASIFLDELSPHLTERLEIRERPRRESSWSPSNSFDDEDRVITIDRFGEQSRGPQPGTTIFKSTKKSTELPKRSFLRDISEL